MLLTGSAEFGALANTLKKPWANDSWFPGFGIQRNESKRLPFNSEARKPWWECGIRGFAAGVRGTDRAKLIRPSIRALVSTRCSINLVECPICGRGGESLYLRELDVPALLAA